MIYDFLDNWRTIKREHLAILSSLLLSERQSSARFHVSLQKAHLPERIIIIGLKLSLKICMFKFQPARFFLSSIDIQRASFHNVSKEFPLNFADFFHFPILIEIRFWNI